MYGGEGDGGGVRGEKAAKQVTAVRDYVSTFVSLTPKDTFQETSRQVSAVFVATQRDIFLDRDSRHLQ